MAKILIADDQQDIIKLICLYLESEDYEIFTANDGSQAIDILKKEDIDLAIIDIMMPKLNGYELIKFIREEKKKYISIIVISAKVNLTDRVLGLDLGADDYITKPFEPLELVAKVKSHFRRLSFEDREESIIELGEIVLNKDECKLVKNGQSIDLTRSELMVLELLIKNPGRVFTNDQIYQYAWDETSVVDDNTIRVIISRLRSKIGHEHITTIRGLGYRYEE